jgi:hypothetical protein
MVASVKVPGRVFVFRIVAAAYIAADQADAQMDPAVPDFQAVSTAVRAGCDCLDLIQVGALAGLDLPREYQFSFGFRMIHAHPRQDFLSQEKKLKG